MEHFYQFGGDGGNLVTCSRNPLEGQNGKTSQFEPITSYNVGFRVSDLLWWKLTTGRAAGTVVT